MLGSWDRMDGLVESTAVGMGSVERVGAFNMRKGVVTGEWITLAGAASLGADLGDECGVCGVAALAVGDELGALGVDINAVLVGLGL